MPCFASNDRAQPCLTVQAMTKHILVFYHKTFNSIWPCLALHVMIKGQHHYFHCGHDLLWKWWPRGNTSTHNLARPCCASDDWWATPVHTSIIILAMSRCASHEQEARLVNTIWTPPTVQAMTQHILVFSNKKFNSIWPCLALQVMTEGQQLP